MLNKVDTSKLPPDHPLLSLSKDKFVEKAPPSKFSAKLEYAERCAALALVRAGVDRRIVAVAFNVDRRTISHIVNPQSVHYKDVRREFDKLGPTEFTVQYVTPEVVERVGNAKLDPVVFLSDDKVPRSVPDTPNPRAKGAEGIHVLKPEQCKNSHRIEIAWRDNRSVDDEDAEWGWHYRDLDSTMPDTWFHNGPESLLTSQNCKRMAEANLTDD